MGSVRLCPHFSSSALIPRSSACATAQVTAASDFSMPTALGGCRISWHLSHTLSPSFHSPVRAICLALHAFSLGVSVGLAGSLWTLLLLTSPGWPHCCQRTVPGPQSPHLP